MAKEILANIISPKHFNLILWQEQEKEFVMLQG
jgi:hypothetical protein